MGGRVVVEYRESVALGVDNMHGPHRGEWVQRRAEGGRLSRRDEADVTGARPRWKRLWVTERS